MSSALFGRLRQERILQQSRAAFPARHVGNLAAPTSLDYARDEQRPMSRLPVQVPRASMTPQELVNSYFKDYLFEGFVGLKKVLRRC